MPAPTSETAVANAAPATPILAAKIAMGSSTKLSVFDASDTLRGVTVSSSPRKAAKPIEEINAGMSEIERNCRYCFAYSADGAPVGITSERKAEGLRTSITVPMAPNTLAKNNASETRVRAVSMSPRPAALATRGAVIVGIKAMTKNAEKKTWFAAACPAKARASPMRPIQKVSTAPTTGITAKLAMDGNATPRISLSRASRLPGSASRQRGVTVALADSLHRIDECELTRLGLLTRR
mmetsp:Transcript_141043/g.259785  ORF Transcript_141043/g.259785 Transcript_141043/m.259785 type:complete len:238 (-) Transcript_141043:276-989(-)